MESSPLHTSGQITVVVRKVERAGEGQGNTALWSWLVPRAERWREAVGANAGPVTQKPGMEQTKPRPPKAYWADHL